MKVRKFSPVMLFLAVLFLKTPVFAVPNLINIQGQLKDSNGNKVNGTFAMSFNFYDKKDSSTPIYGFTPSSMVEVKNGIFSVVIDFGSEDIFKNYDELYLGVKVENQPEFPKILIIPVGYGIRSKYADYLLNPAADLDCEGCVNSEDIAEGSVDNSKISSVSWTKLTDVPQDLADGDDDTKYQAGEGLSLSGTTFSLGADYLSGAAYDSRFVNVKEPDSIETGMIVNGAVTNEKISSVSWNKITDVPSDLADGDDVGITGSGTAGVVPVFSSSNVLKNSYISQSGSSISIGSASSPLDSVNIYGKSLSALHLRTSVLNDTIGIILRRDGDSDIGYLYLENYGMNGVATNQHRLVLASGDDGDQDYVVIRHHHCCGYPDHDIMEFHYSYTKIGQNDYEIPLYVLGKVGVKTTSPQADLDVNGTIKFGGRVFKRVTVCSFTGTPNYVPGKVAHRYHAWTGSDCDNGLPSGSCIGFLTRASECGPDEDWAVILPGEKLPTGATAINGGMEWWNGSPCNSLHIAATYFCSQ